MKPEDLAKLSIEDHLRAIATGAMMHARLSDKEEDRVHSQVISDALTTAAEIVKNAPGVARDLANLNEELRIANATIRSMREVFKEGAKHLSGSPANYPEQIRKFVFLVQEEALK